MSVEHSCLPYGHNIKKSASKPSTYKKGDRVIIKLVGEITAPATLVRDPYVSNFKRDCVCVTIDKVDGDKYIYVEDIVGYEEENENDMSENESDKRVSQNKRRRSGSSFTTPSSRGRRSRTVTPSYSNENRDDDIAVIFHE